MNSSVPPTLRGVISFALMLLNTMFWGTPVNILALTKVAIRNDYWQRTCAHMLMFLGNCWISGMNTIIRFTQPTIYDIKGVEGLSKDEWYFVNSNHQSWADILVLFLALHKHTPFLKFFLKKELIWVPILGTAWWALDYPYMQRFSKEYLEKNPHMKGKDLETTRKACERYRHTPVAIMNYVEGTRLTAEKHASQQSPYRHLLKPKAGGFAFALSAMEGKIKTILDVTIIYSQNPYSFWDFICGKIDRITVLLRKLPVPEEFLTGDYQNDQKFRDNIQTWITKIWQEKDDLIEQNKDLKYKS